MGLRIKDTSCAPSIIRLASQTNPLSMAERKALPLILVPHLPKMASHDGFPHLVSLYYAWQPFGLKAQQRYLEKLYNP
jgi:hypothetical protein